MNLMMSRGRRIVRAGATRFRHYTRQLAMLVILGRPARYAVASTGCRPRAASGAQERLEELSRRRHRAQIAARHALGL